MRPKNPLKRKRDSSEEQLDKPLSKRRKVENKKKSPYEEFSSDESAGLLDEQLNQQNSFDDFSDEPVGLFDTTKPPSALLPDSDYTFSLFEEDESW